MNYVKNNRENLAKNNYVRKADNSNNYWFDLSISKIDNYREKFNDKFNIIIYGGSSEGDFYIIPYEKVSHVLLNKNLPKSGKNKRRWIGDIKFHQFRIRNSDKTIDISSYYGIDEISQSNLRTDKFIENDYAIQNKRIEINSRLKQSKFRKSVLKNFNSKCCVTGISEKTLLIASHIIPWSENIENRLNPSNGLCLFVLIDKLFDKGYISFDKEFKLIISSVTKNNNEIYDMIKKYDGKKISKTKDKPISNEFMEYHRENIFKKS